ncbi:MAG: hypothetical protein ACU0BS_06540, partial [Hasllibacter sp.]
MTHRPRPARALGPALLACALAWQPAAAQAQPLRAETLLEAVGPGEGMADPSLAVGLAAFNYWTSPPFLNLVRQSSKLQIRNAEDEQVGAEALREMGLLDAQGYPVGMLPGNETLARWKRGYQLIVSIHHQNEGIRRETSGEYVVTWSGAGLVGMSGFEVSERAAFRDADGVVTGGRLVGAWPVENKLRYLNILDTDPEGTGNHVRDVAIVRAEYRELHELGALFDPRYLATVRDHRAVRFMDWMGTNGSDAAVPEDAMDTETATASWIPRTNAVGNPDTSPGRVLERGGHMPFEAMVQLANQVGADPWFTIPLKADDAYVRAMARVVDAQLDPELVAIFELSNEVWNFAGGFTQTREASLMETGGAKQDDLRAARVWYGHRSAQVRAILDEEMGRVPLRMVAGTHTVRPEVARWVEPGVARHFEERGEAGA